MQSALLPGLATSYLVNATVLTGEGDLWSTTARGHPHQAPTHRVPRDLIDGRQPIVSDTPMKGKSE